MTSHCKVVLALLVLLGTLAAFTPMAVAASSGAEIFPSGGAVATGNDDGNAWDVPDYASLSVKTTTPPAETETSFREALEEGFDDFDTNGNGQVSFAEAHAALPGLTQAVFDTVDTDGNGQISRAEAGLGEGCFGCTGTAGGLLKHLGDIFMAALALLVMTLFGQFWESDRHDYPDLP